MKSAEPQKFIIKNTQGIYAEISNFGARILSLYTPDKEGNFADILIGFDDSEQYKKHDPYFNVVCGRYAGRIGEASFMLNGKQIALTKNCGKDQLHGGFNGFHLQYWDVKSYDDQQITLAYLSKDGEEGYPGNLHVSVTYSIDDQNRFFTQFRAQTDIPTVVNMCQHAYFNLKGSGLIHQHQLQINSTHFAEFDDQFINTGDLLPVQGTPLDFRTPKAIGSVIDDSLFQHSLGIDHCFAIDQDVTAELTFACRLQEPESGRVLRVFTNQPALVVYSGNYIEHQIGKRGNQNGKHSAICLETQAFPNAPNCNKFPSTILNPGEQYNSITCWKFSM